MSLKVSHSHAPVKAQPAAARRATTVEGDAPPKKSGDAFHSSAGLPPFASFYREAKKVPQLPAGKRLQTFDEAQVQALHRAYWSAPATASLADMVKLAFKDPAFKGLKADAGTERQVGRLFADLPESFPWGWRSRGLAATSHVLVDALVKHPKGTPFRHVVEGLIKADKSFPAVNAWMQAQRRSWVEDPARFPFLDKLPKVNGMRQLEAVGSTNGAVQKHVNGHLVLDEALAKKVHTLLQDPRIHFDWRTPDYAKFIDGELKTSGAFTEATLKNLQTQFPRLVPGGHAIHAGAAKRLAENIRRLYDNEGIDTVAAMRVEVKKRFDVELGPTELTYLRKAHSDVIPVFREKRDQAARSDAQVLVDAIKANPEQTYVETGRQLGYEPRRVQSLLRLVRDQLPAAEIVRYSKEDKAKLRAFYDRHELGETAQQMFARIKVEEPDLAANFGNSESLYNALRAQLGIPTLAQTRQAEWVKLFAGVAKRSPAGTTLRETVQLLQDEYPGAYGESAAKRILKHAADFPELQKLRDTKGRYPWEKGQIALTESLAKKVGEAITKHKGKTHRQLAAALLRDDAFAKEYPTFSYATIHHLRAKFPKLVPYVDDLAVRGDEKRIDAQHRELKKAGDEVAAAAAKLGDADGITVAEIARRTGLKPYRVLSAIRFDPGRFPWYSARPSGDVDLFLATRVAYEMSKAPLGATLGDIEAALEKDPRFKKRYPAFGYPTFQALRERYPDIVPQWATRQQVVRSKLIVDAMAGGKSFNAAVRELQKQHPGQFEGRFADEKYVRELWASDPELFAFTDPKHPVDESADSLADRLAKLERIPDRLPILDRLMENGDLRHKEFFKDFELLAIQHVLGSQVPMFDALRALGAKPDRASIVAIPYSVSAPVAETLEDKGWDVRVPPLDLDAWYELVREALEERIAAAKKSGRKVLVMDDGGLVEMMFEKYPHLQKDRQLVKIVEQTRRGITVADGVELHEAVVNVAQSWSKYVEGPMIGSSLEAKAVSRLAAIGVENLKGKHIGLVGYGTIGAPLAQFLAKAGAIVTVLDKSEASLKDAKEAGLRVETDREKFFSKQDIIFGTTGVRSMTAEDLALLKDGAIIGSGSSKLVEIDVDALAEMARQKGGKVEVVDAKSHPPTVRYTDGKGKQVTLLARGFPMNFDGSIEDISAERIQLTRGLMLIGALQAAGMSAAGIHRLDPDLQLRLLRAFEHVGGRKQGKEVIEALDLAKDNLGHLAKKHGATEHDRRHRA